MDVLFVCYGGGHSRIIASVVASLPRSVDYRILPLTLAIPFFANSAVSEDIVLLSEIFDDGDYVEVSKIFEKADNLLALINIDHSIPLIESKFYLGLSYLELEEKLGVDNAKVEYMRQGLQSFLQVDVMLHVLQRLKPKMVVTTNAPRMERAAIVAADKLDIPTVMIFDNLWVNESDKQLYARSIVRKMCVFSSHVKELLLENDSNISNTEIVITGNPAFDKLSQMRSEYKLRASRRSGIRVLFADCCFPPQHPKYSNITSDATYGDKLRSALYRISMLCEDIDIIFRAHPSQSEDVYIGFPNVNISRPDSDVHQELLDIDVVVTAISTVGLEGLILGCGLVSLEDSIYSVSGSYSKIGLSTGVSSFDQIESAIRMEVNKCRSNNNGFEVGDSSSNIVSVIMKELHD